MTNSTGTLDTAALLRCRENPARKEHEEDVSEIHQMLVLERKLANTEAPFTPNDITSAVVRKRLVGTTEVLYILPTSEPGADFGHLSSDILTTVKIILQRMSKPADNTQQLIDKEMHKLWNLVLVE